VKKNLFLLSIIISLIGFVYFWEELGNKQRFIDVSSEEKVVLFDITKVVELTLKNTKIIKDADDWIIGDLGYKADNAKIRFILKTLNGIIKIKELKVSEDKEKEFFTHQDQSFTVKTFDKKVTFRLGDISPVTGQFYLEKFELGKKEIYLCRDINVYDGLYKNELEAEYQKYIALKDIITSSPMNLINPILINDLDVSNIAKITIDNTYNRWFEIDFLNSKTTPEVFSSVNYNNLKKQFNFLWKKVKVTRISENSLNILTNIISTVTLQMKSQEKFKIELFGLLDGVEGYYARVNSSKEVYFIDQSAKDFFFANVQDFWDKRINFNVDFSGLDKLEFKLFNKSKSFSFVINDLKTFIVESSEGLKVKQLNMNLLFNILFSLTDFRQAQFINPELSNSVKGVKVGVKLLERTFNLYFSSNLITVQDVENKLEYIYPHKNKAINIQGLEDFFALN